MLCKTLINWIVDIHVYCTTLEENLKKTNKLHVGVKFERR